MADIIALRASPDWLHFDLSETRSFLRSIGFEDDLLDRFVALWDRHLAVDYRTFRHRLKTIALDTARQPGTSLVEREALEAAEPTDRVVFLDDDDWLAPGLFAHLSPAQDGEGQRWSSIRIGLDYDVTAPGAAAIQCRPPSTVVYTNNYMVTGLALKRHGVEAVFEHYRAQAIFDRLDVTIVDHPQYLSCAVKHPCSTTAVHRLMGTPDFARDPKAIVADFAGKLATTPIPPEATWMTAPVASLIALLKEAAMA
jgi:hypothetical protein